MSRLCAFALPMAVLLTMGCQGGAAPTAPLAPAGDATALGLIAQGPGTTESVLGLYRLQVDPASLTGTIELEASRGLMANDDVYELSITNFLRRDSLRLRQVTRTATTLDVDYTFEHPFPSPQDPAGTPNGSTNRADLGVAGRLLILADVASSTGNTYFTDVVANTQLIANADAYYQPEGLLVLTTTATCFPYKVLVDESGTEGARVGVPNGGDPTGNFGTDGWTRAEFGATNDGWTGFGVLHQGQMSRNTLSLALSEMSGGVDLTVAVLAKYNDPRQGTNSIEKRGNRLPPATPDASKFAYRMPHGALDVESIAFAGAVGDFEPNVISASTLRFQVVDWDARALETGAADLSEDADVTTVAVGESGTPSLSVCIPGVLGDASTVEDFTASDLLDDDTAIGGDVDVDAGRPGDALFYERLVSKAAGSGQTGGSYTGFVRATDPEPASLVIPLDGTTLAPLSTGLPEAVTYQAFPVQLGSPNLPPEFTGSMGLQLNPDCLGSAATFTIENVDLNITDPESDPISYTVIGTPDVGAPVEVSNVTGFPISNAATGPWTNPAVTQVTFTVYANDPAHPGASGTLLLSTPVPLVARVALGPPFASTFPGTVAGTDMSRGNAVATTPQGELVVLGFFSGSIDLDPSAGIDTHVSIGGNDIFISKFDPLGNFLWGKIYGGAGSDSASDLAVDANGNLYIAGGFQQTVDFDPGVGVATRACAGVNLSDVDGYGLSLDSAGNFRWVSQYGAPMNTGVPQDDYLQSVALDAGGNPVFVGLHCSGVSDLDPGAGTFSPTGFGSYDCLFWQLNAADGSFVRAARMGSNTVDFAQDITFDSTGSMIVLQQAYGTADFDPTAGVQNVTGGTGFNMFICKYNGATWAPLWIDQFQVQLPAYLLQTGLVVDSANNIYCSAETSNFGTLDLDPGAGLAVMPPIQGVYDGFLVSVDPAGAYRWHASVTGSAADYGHGVTVQDDRVLWSGSFTGTNIDFDPGPGTFLLSATNTDAFVASFDAATGAFQRAGRIGGGGYDEGEAIVATDTCQLALTGVAQATVDFDPGTGVQNRSALSFTSYLAKLYSGSLSF